MHFGDILTNSALLFKSLIFSTTFNLLLISFPTTYHNISKQYKCAATALISNVALKQSYTDGYTSGIKLLFKFLN